MVMKTSHMKTALIQHKGPFINYLTQKAEVCLGVMPGNNGWQACPTELVHVFHSWTFQFAHLDFYSKLSNFSKVFQIFMDFHHKTSI